MSRRGFMKLVPFIFTLTKNSSGEIKESSVVDEELFWKVIRSEFIVSNKGIYLNSGTLGLSPRYVLEGTIRDIISQEVFFTEERESIEEIKRIAGEFLGAEPEEIVLTRNTTEGMSMVAGGLELKSGDEVILTNHEHVGGTACWEVKEKRDKVKIKRVEIPLTPSSEDEIIKAISKAITKRTKVISISHILCTNGTIMPIKRICEFASSKGILTLIDGAHAPGMIKLNIKEIGCNFYAGSFHKWLLAPKGTGFLYIKKDRNHLLYPIIASENWNEIKKFSDRFTLGTMNNSLMVGLKRAFEFHNNIGREKIELRIRELNTYLRSKISEIPSVEIKSPSDPRLYCGMVAFRLKGLSSEEVCKILRERYKIEVRYVHEYSHNLVRVSTHIYNNFSEIDRFYKAIKEISKGI
ncbi:MAG: aminotransferase class V-fold PLP-dependent enzyme [Candidatus Aminicenantia bacterium]